MAATIKDIAEETGLGLATISSYLNGGNVRDQNRIKIEKAIEDLQYEVNEMARGLKTNKSKIIGVVIPELSNVFITEIITIIEDVLRNHGYATLVCDCRTDPKIEKEVVEFLYKKRVEGIINMPVTSDGSHLDLFVKNKKPIVLIDRKLKNIKADSVLVENILAVSKATQMLIEKGHSKIGFIAGPKEVYTSQERIEGYKLGLSQAGLIPDDRLITYGDYTINGGVNNLKELVKNNPEMTSVIVSNAEMMIGALIGINELELKIPEDISVIGFDNVEFAKAMNPKLTIVTQPTEEIALNTARIILNRLEDQKKYDEKEHSDDNEYETIELPTKIIHGKSIKDIS